MALFTATVEVSSPTLARSAETHVASTSGEKYEKQLFWSRKGGRGDLCGMALFTITTEVSYTELACRAGSDVVHYVRPAATKDNQCVDARVFRDRKGVRWLIVACAVPKSS